MIFKLFFMIYVINIVLNFFNQYSEALRHTNTGGT